jgi:hypothetical protein
MHLKLFIVALVCSAQRSAWIHPHVVHVVFADVHY